MKRSKQVRPDKEAKLSTISKIHYGKMALRGALFLAAATAYILGKVRGESVPLRIFSAVVLSAAWLLLSVEMVLRFFPSPTESMGCQRQFAVNYRPTGYPPVPPRNQRRQTVWVVLVWLALNGGIGVLYFTHIIDRDILVLISLAYAVCDMICILLFCPFQVLFFKNKCCNTCRIYNWDFAMMFTPLVFAPGFFNYSLLAMGIILLLRWEITLRRHPERFYELSNQSLDCAHCRERLCNQKTHIHRLRLQIMAELKAELNDLREEIQERADEFRNKK
ncbi:MAG: hypothetical protein PUB51_06540 [Oscillospiraceae bacterium]|nr:hypothetical protein [Oscillospiraceae bacterium]